MTTKNHFQVKIWSTDYNEYLDIEDNNYIALIPGTNFRIIAINDRNAPCDVEFFYEDFRIGLFDIDPEYEISVGLNEYQDLTFIAPDPIREDKVSKEDEVVKPSFRTVTVIFHPPIEPATRKALDTRFELFLVELNIDAIEYTPSRPSGYEIMV